MTFLTLFLPLVLMGYYVCFLPVSEKRWPGAHRMRANLFLLAASLLFFISGAKGGVCGFWLRHASEIFSRPV